MSHRKVSLGRTAIPAKSTANINVIPSNTIVHRDGEGFLPEAVVCPSLKAGEVKITAIASADVPGKIKDHVALGLPSGIGIAVEVEAEVVPRDKFVSVSVENLTSTDFIFEGEVVGRLVSADSPDELESDEEEPGKAENLPRILLRKCMRWFQEGFGQAVADASEQRIHAPVPISRDPLLGGVIAEKDRPERIRDHLRSLIANGIRLIGLPLSTSVSVMEALHEDFLSGQEEEEPDVEYATRPLPIGPRAVKEGERISIVTQSQLAFRPRCLLIPNDVAEMFHIADIKVGKYSQFLSADPIPATAFKRHDGSLLDLMMDVAAPGQAISIDVIRLADEKHARIFSAVLIGDVLTGK